MKKFVSIVLTLALLSGTLALAGCKAKAKAGAGVLTVGATPVPHAELLNLVKDDLAAAGVELTVREFTDYVQPNEALAAGELDANFFQHLPYLASNEGWKTALVPVFGVHVEPMGFYSRSIKALEELKDGASVAIPNDPTNGGRALLLLQTHGLITLAPGAGITASPQQITGNPKGIVFRELEAALLPRALDDVDGAVINGNYALQAGLNPLKDAVVIEGQDSPYVNIVVVKKGNEKDRRVLALEKALKSPKVKDFILSKYDGAVVPAF